jgi:tetratricopeptide (TPR) repeat protein
LVRAARGVGLTCAIALGSLVGSSVGPWAGSAHSQAESQSESPLQSHSDNREANLRSARQHFANGKEAFQGKRYRAAFEEFQAGYEIDPRPGFLLDMAHAARKMGELEKARALYHRFLLVAPAGDERRLAEDLLGEIDSQLAKDPKDRAVVAPRDDAESSADHDALAEPPAPILPAVPVTPEPLVESPPGLRPVAQPSDAPDQNNPTRLKWWFWAGIAALAAGTATIFILRSAGSGDDVHTSGTWGQARL